MGRLKPGATYIYEKADGVTYAREINAHPGDRFPIGWDYDLVKKNERADRIQLWERIHLAAQTNPALQEALDRAKIIYQLTKPNE